MKGDGSYLGIENESLELGGMCEFARLSTPQIG
jgi:hypothetical protein